LSADWEETYLDTYKTVSVSLKERWNNHQWINNSNIITLEYSVCNDIVTSRIKRKTFLHYLFHAINNLYNDLLHNNVTC
jgi:hypothetical protein